MARLINLTTPETGITQGMEVSFRAPCDCSDATGVTLEGVTYTFVDASGEALTGCSKYFVKDAILTVIIDTVKQTATLLNPRVNTYTKTLGTPDDEASASGSTVWARVKQVEEEIAGKAPAVHSHTKSEITDFAHNHDDRYYTEDEVNTKLNGKSNTGHKHTKSEITDFPTAMTPTSHTHKKSEITDFPASMPASDVYSWAKAKNKPSYSANEVGAAVIKKNSTTLKTVTFSLSGTTLTITTT